MDGFPIMGIPDTGDTAWMLASSALVLLMTPGLAFFYGGMVRAKGVLNMLMMSISAMGVVTVLWVLYGYSLSFGNDKFDLFGDPTQYWGLKGLIGGNAKAAVAAVKGAKSIHVLSRKQVPDAPNLPCDLLINATPVGVFPMVDATPLAGPIPADVVFDMVYNPPITRLLRSARDQGKTVIQGTTMFLAQAARQFEIWTGHRAPSEIFEEKTGLS